MLGCPTSFRHPAHKHANTKGAPKIWTMQRLVASCYFGHIQAFGYTGLSLAHLKYKNCRQRKSHCEKVSLSDSVCDWTTNSYEISVIVAGSTKSPGHQQHYELKCYKKSVWEGRARFRSERSVIFAGTLLLFSARMSGFD